jgi:diguanylate cyclase (GGDEF)-like protein
MHLPAALLMEPTRILLVDDLPANLHTLSRALADEYELSVATSGAAALRLAEQLLPDLILLDVMMPDLDGLQTLARLRATSWGREIPVILITADARTATQVEGLERGAEDFITKPVVVPVVQARVRNLLERHRLRRELIRRATIDELTGVLNRRRFLERSQEEHRRLTRYPDACGLLMLDVDRFKAINDDHGHATGDEALRTIGATLPSLLREPDLVGRIGGEEFPLLLPQTDRAGSLALAERIRRTIAQLPIGTDPDGHLRLTVSIGVTQLTPDDPDLETAMRRADAALYAAKDAGRDQVHEHAAAVDLTAIGNAS